MSAQATTSARSSAPRPGGGLGASLASAFRTAPALASGTASLALLQAIAPALFAVLSARLVGALPAAVASPRSGAAHEIAVHRLHVLLFWTLLTFCLMRLLPTLQGVCTGRLGRRMNSALQRRVTIACQTPLQLDHFDDPEVQGAISLVRDDTNGLGLPGSAIAGFFGVIGNKLSPLGGVVVLFHYSWPVALVGLAFYVLATTGMLRALMLLAGSQITARSSFLPSEYLRTTALDARPARELRVFGLSPWVRGRISTSYLGAMRDLWRTRDRFMMLLAGSLLVSSTTFGALLLAHVAREEGAGRISFTVFLIIFESLGLVMSINIDGTDLQAMLGGAAMTAIQSLEAKAAAASVVSRRSTSTQLELLAPVEQICLEDVSFRHAGSAVDVLSGLNLVIPAGQRLAIVGLNGAGKTTLATVLAGLRRPTGGRLLVDEIDLDTEDYRLWQRRVAVLSQGFVHYPLTAYDNVAVGAPEIAADHGAVLHAAELAGAGSVVAAIDSGWDTVLSPIVKGGTDLSGGQWQRIGLARALLAVAGGARVLILDEPTSALDVRAEAALFSELIAMPALRDITVILISHRFSSVRQSERIVFLEGGAVAEDGSHEELLAVRGRYAALFQQQAALFLDAKDGDAVLADA